MPPLRSAFAFVLVCAGISALEAQTALSRDYPVKPVPFTAVHLRDTFWLPRIEMNRKVTIPFAFRMCEESGRMYNFDRAAAVLRGEDVADRKAPGYPFDDTDIYKVIEGAAYALAVQPDAKLEAYVDGLVRKISAAQEPDGYLYTTRTIDPLHPHVWAGARRWEKEEELSHELYNLGHLYEAAFAYYQATGKRQLLDIALKTANLLDATFGPGKQSIYPGHQIAEMGLVKMYRASADGRYLDMAKFLLDARKYGNAYNQAHLPVVEQRDAVGHAVRATYMYSGIADVAALTGDRAYVEAIDRLWESVAGRKMYVTGGIGSTAHGEAFGGDYDLPNMTAYNETCAAIGNDYWNHRLFLLHADARYIDVLERTLYNGLLSGVALDGKSFFYPNPLESNGQHQRSPWFGCACCPSNVTRFLASVPGYVYAQEGANVYVNLYAASEAELKLANTSVKLRQETRYPWDGSVRLIVTPAQASQFAMRLRIPGWARGEASPTGLYRFADRNDATVQLRVNGRPVEQKMERGYAVIAREWKAGDVIQLDLPMPVRRVAARDEVAADRGRVALQRGPVVYCAEWPDNGGHARNLVLPRTAAVKAEFRPELLNGIVRLTSQGESLARDRTGNVQRTARTITAIPYYAWANRGAGEMLVWLPESSANAWALPPQGIAQTGKVSASVDKNARPVQDGEWPATSATREAYADFDWAPNKGATDWVEYTFQQAVRISSSSVFWIHSGGCKVPAGWRILYRVDGHWAPVEASGSYATAVDQMNKVSFRPVTTTALRLEVTEQAGATAGVHEWVVE